jgi:hypothetical protein
MGKSRTWNWRDVIKKQITNWQLPVAIRVVMRPGRWSLFPRPSRRCKSGDGQGNVFYLLSGRVYSHVCRCVDTCPCMHRNLHLDTYLMIQIYWSVMSSILFALRAVAGTRPLSGKRTTQGETEPYELEPILQDESSRCLRFQSYCGLSL